MVAKKQQRNSGWACSTELEKASETNGKITVARQNYVQKPWLQLTKRKGPKRRAWLVKTAETPLRKDDKLSNYIYSAVGRSQDMKGTRSSQGVFVSYLQKNRI